MEVLTGIMIAGFIFYSGKLINAEWIRSKQFFLLAAMMLAYQPVDHLQQSTWLFIKVLFPKEFLSVDKPIEIKNDNNLPKLKISNCNIEFKNVDFKYVLQLKKLLKILI